MAEDTPQPDDGSTDALASQVASLAAQLSELQETIAQLAKERDDTKKQIDGVSKSLDEEVGRRAGEAADHDWGAKSDDTRERIRIDDIMRRLHEIEAAGGPARPQRSVFLANLATSSTWSELLSVGGSLTTGGPRRSPPLSGLSKRDGSYPLLEVPDTTHGTAYYLIDRTGTVEIVSAQTKPGTYNGRFRKSFTSDLDGAGSTPLAIGDFGESGDTCIVINGAELGASGHALSVGDVFPGIIIGRGDPGDYPCVFIWGRGVGSRSGPTTIGQSSDGGETANTADWSHDDDGTPVNIWVIGRVVYNDAGDEKLYAYARMLSFDSAGALYAVSAETRYEVDPPEDCS